ncbi:class I SAM-dependent methyltransferase [Streptomyces sp. STCH 565 A]|uniref:class I SAM-dependent methyltransferase n=1 Tax=Streptomyces sp. STCH 565 A TaxID=2950532 RepID=UPI0020765AEC|nr:class I SAM-dependent methyltransferase [Streptomyces sp. STCH 565 A]MCM8548902.1 class I SAM-dependent methyltransferase [Streptomyces sp. STCH 565 A]
MPTSDAEGKDWSLALFERHLPNTVTDVGPGEGTYARLFRPVHAGIWWTAIEIYKPYVAKYKLRSTKTRRMYDEIHIEDVRESEDHLFHRDLVILGDVLEHMPRGSAVTLLETIVAAGAWHILVSVPIVDSPQGEVDGNPHEAHVHQWAADDMDAVMARLGGTVETFRGGTLGCWWWTRT